MNASMILAPNGRPANFELATNNWYEASRWSPNRQWIWFPLQDAKRDLDRFTQYELRKRSRYLWKNSPLIRGLVERLVTLVIGSGFVPLFRTGDDKWDARFLAWWIKRARNIHLGPRCSFSQYQRAIGRARFVDGECFSIKTFEDTLTLEDRIQGIEADRVTGSGGAQAGEANGGVDGFLLNNQGSVLGYKLRGVEQPYPADTIIHHATPRRLGEYRPEPILSAAINMAQDVDDILALEKQAVKSHSRFKDVIETETGELDPESHRTLRWDNPFPTTFNLPIDDKTKTDYYKVSIGAESVVMKRGDKYTPLKPDRPGPAWMGFMDFLANTICVSSSFPASIILPIDIGGTDIRRDLDIAQRVVEPWQFDIAAELEEIVKYFADGEVADGELRGAPAYSIDWQFPQKINVDRQTAREDREDWKCGLMSTAEYHGRYGGNGKVYEAGVIKEVARRKDEIIAAGFKDTREFVELLSLDAKMFASRITEAITPADDALAGKKGKTNAA